MDPQAWLVIARPDHLHTALITADAVAHRFPGGCHLIREHSQWWQRARWQEFGDRFTTITQLPRLETCRGLLDLPRFYRDTAQRQRTLAALPIDAERDTLFVVAGTLGIGNAAASAHPNVYKILRASQKSFEDLKRPVDRARYRFTTSGWLQNRVVDPLNGVQRTVNLKPRINPGGDGVRVGRLQKDPEEIYDAILVETRTGEIAQPHGRAVIPTRPPRISDLSWLGDTGDAGPARRRRRVVFFGTPFLLVKNIEPEIYVRRLNDCLDYLRTHYAESCDLVYRPHPAETDESSRLNLAGINLENDREAAELYFLRHFRAIEAVYTVSSSVARVALHNGLRAYALWPVFPFPTLTTDFFARLMGDVPPEFMVRDLGQPPARYNADAGAEGLPTFAGALNHALDMRGAPPAAR